MRAVVVLVLVLVAGLALAFHEPNHGNRAWPAPNCRPPPTEKEAAFDRTLTLAYFDDEMSRQVVILNGEPAGDERTAAFDHLGYLRLAYASRARPDWQPMPSCSTPCRWGEW